MNADLERCAAEGHCVTCSDEGAPMRVVAVGAEDGTALCLDGAGQASEILTDLVEAVAVGDELLVHAGVALLRLGRAAEGSA